MIQVARSIGSPAKDHSLLTRSGVGKSPADHPERAVHRFPGHCRALVDPRRQPIWRLRLVHSFSSPTNLYSFSLGFLDLGSPAPSRGMAIAVRFDNQPCVGRVKPLRRAFFRAPRCARLPSRRPLRWATSLHVNPSKRSSYACWSPLRASMTCA